MTQPESFVGWDDLTTKGIDTIPKVTYPLILLLAQDLNIRYLLLILFSAICHLIENSIFVCNDNIWRRMIGITVDLPSSLWWNLRRSENRLCTPYLLKRCRNIGLDTFIDAQVLIGSLFAVSSFDIKKSTAPKRPRKVTITLLLITSSSFDFTQVQSYGDLVNGSFHNSAIGLLEQGRIEVAATSMLLRRDRMRMTHFVSESADLKFFRYVVMLFGVFSKYSFKKLFKK